MKKTLALILVILVASLGYFYFIKKEKAPAPSNTKTYRNSTLGLSFIYPNMLTASTTGSSVVVHHEVPFEHPDYCDFRGDNAGTQKNLTDFNIAISLSDKDIVETIKQKSPYISPENFVNGKVVTSPGFIDEVVIGNLSGYKIIEGVEGCGHTTYFFKISDNKTLVVVSDMITIFTGAIPEETASRAKAVPGIITSEEADQILKSIISTLKAR